MNTFNFSEDSKRLIIVETKRNDSDTMTLTTSSYMQQQMGKKNIYDDKDFYFTTPMTYNLPKPGGLHFERESSDFFPEENQSNHKLKLFSNHETAVNLRNHRLNSKQSVQRRQFNEDQSNPRPFNYVLKGTPPSAFEAPKTTSTRSPNHYFGPVNSIQDILRQVRNPLVAVAEDVRPAPAPEHRSGRKMRFGGTYRHRKDSDISQMFSPSSHQFQTSFKTPMPETKEQPKQIVTDPFFQFKPHSMSDINLLAMNQFRFAPLQHGIIGNDHSTRNPTANHLNPADLYQQIIAVNKNRDAEELSRKNSRYDHEVNPKHKPFSLMLDIYPMLDDPEAEKSTKRPKHSLKFRAPFRMIPQQPNIVNAINSLPLHLKHHYFQNMQFPQIRPPVGIHSNEDAQNYYNQNMYFKKLHMNRDAVGLPVFSIGNMLGRHSGPNNHNENSPSQMTVHLNLFPKNKTKRRKVDDVDGESGQQMNERVDDDGEISVDGKRIYAGDKLENIDQASMAKPDEPVSMAIKVSNSSLFESLNTDERLPADDMTTTSNELKPVWGGKVKFIEENKNAFITNIPIEPRVMDSEAIVVSMKAEEYVATAEPNNNIE